MSKKAIAWILHSEYGAPEMLPKLVQQRHIMADILGIAMKV